MQLDENKYYLELKKKKKDFLSFDLAASATNDDRAKKFIFSFEGLFLDISRQRIPTHILDKFLSIGKVSNIQASIQKLFKGEFFNVTEKRKVTHFLERNPTFFHQARKQRLENFENSIKKKGIKKIINVGIGGSDLGLKMIYQALKPIKKLPQLINVSNIDPRALHDAISGDYEKDIFFIFNSKSFLTEEIIANLHLIREWLISNKMDFDDHTCAVTSFPENALKHGFKKENIFVVDKGVGGRFSLWSDFGLGLVGSLGTRVFQDLLAGGHSMDQHFLNEDLDSNLPYILGLTRIWNRNILDFPSLGIIPYSESLKFFHTWAQQVEMESNGKNIDTDGIMLRNPVSPLIFGGVGTDAQHSFFQALHQGTDTVPIEILVAINSSVFSEFSELSNQNHAKLVSNALAQAESLMSGKRDSKDNFRIFKGGRPSTLISWEKTDALSLGRLLSLYENASIVSGLIWGVNSFDQFGVELGKETAKNISEKKDFYNISSAGKVFLRKL